jgi:uncharacterized membrane protein YbhN (UPF0104 family)
MSRKTFFLLLRFVLATVFAYIGFRVLAHEFRTLSPEQVVDSLKEVGAGPLWLSILGAVIGFSAMTPYDKFALRYFGNHLTFGQSALSSTGAYALANLVGFPAFTGNAIRYWLFSHWGLGVRETAASAVVTWITCNVTLMFIIGLALVTSPNVLTHYTTLSPQAGIVIGWLLIVASSALIYAGVRGPKTIKVERLTFSRPGRILLPHLGLCVIDYFGTASVMYFPLSPVLHMDFLPFVALFAVAKLLGIMSNVPGGLGVFEAIMATAMPRGSEAVLAASLILYRAVYFLIPSAIAAGALAVHAFLRARRRASPRPPSIQTDELAD